MASQVVGEASCFEWHSFIRGHHEYTHVWNPTIGDTLRLRIEPDNQHDRYAVAVLNEDTIVGHVPRSKSKVVHYFLRKTESVGFCEVTGGRVNRGVGFGVEVPCIYKFYGQKAYVQRLQLILTA